MSKVRLALALLAAGWPSSPLQATEPPVDCPDLEILSNFEESRSLIGEEWEFGKTFTIDIASYDNPTAEQERIFGGFGEIALSAFPDEIHVFSAREQDTSRFILSILTREGKIFGFTCTISITP